MEGCSEVAEKVKGKEERLVMLAMRKLGGQVVNDVESRRKKVKGKEDKTKTGNMSWWGVIAWKIKMG